MELPKACMPPPTACKTCLVVCQLASLQPEHNIAARISNELFITSSLAWVTGWVLVSRLEHLRYHTAPHLYQGSPAPTFDRLDSVVGGIAP